MKRLKKHPYYDRLYVTRDGRVFQELKASPCDDGYHTVKIKGGITIRRHTLVAETYKGASNGRVVRHWDGDPGNDDATNLRWGTVKQNGQDTVRHGRTTQGIKNHHAKINENAVREIRQRYAAGESGKALGYEFGLAQSTIVGICKRHTWKHVE